MKRNTKNIIIALIVVILISVILTWAPWLNDKEIHDKVFQEKAQKEGTYDWVIYPNGTKQYELICDYNVMWFPFGRWVVSCEGGYFVTFWAKIL